mmetsp:Transcript_18722/g.50763  ORF Transcript_18722/g.50763 Transcript_18722/m.50763 type:complete len:272 (-) Transcript_18722:1606-2421(-)
MVACSNDCPLDLSSSATDWRISGVILRESKLRISESTDRLPRKRFIETHDVSKLPITRSTPSITSRIASGGILSIRISLRLSDLMLPTACFAASSTGAIRESSLSTSALRSVISISSLASFFCRCSTSPRRSTARSIDFCICSIALSASCCLVVSSARCSTAVFDSLSTSEPASTSFARPPRRCSTRCVSFCRACTKIFCHMWTKLTYMRGVASCAPRVSSRWWRPTICLRSGGRWLSGSMSASTLASVELASCSIDDGAHAAIHSMEQRV